MTEVFLPPFSHSLSQLSIPFFIGPGIDFIPCLIQSDLFFVGESIAIQIAKMVIEKALGLIIILA